MASPRFVKVSSTPPRYLDTESGEEISRRQYEKRRGGYTTRTGETRRYGTLKRASEPRKTRYHYEQAVTRYIDYMQRRGFTGPALKRGAVKRSETMKRIVRDLKLSRIPIDDRTPEQEQRLRQALVDLGLRDKEADYNVGESPT